MSETTPRYLHGTDPDEQDRLSRLNELLNAASLRELRLQAGETVLDVGCGLGQLTRRMTQAVGPAGRVVGVERSSEQLDAAKRRSNDAKANGTVENAIELMSGVKQDILALGSMSATFFDDAMQAFRNWGSLPNAALWYALPLAEGLRM